jgi:nucleoid-associated protein YgaU
MTKGDVSMAKKSDFEWDEWQLLMNAPRYVYSILVTAKGGTDEITKPEAKALSKMLGDYRSDNSLIQAVLAEKKPVTIPEEIAHAPYDQGVKKLEQIGNILSKRVSRDEASGFNDFLLSAAHTVAEASREGFLGLGKKVSDEERRALESISQALKAPLGGERLGGAEAAGVERMYEVKQGDSLSKIALTFYGDSAQWPKIYEANKDQVKDPDLVYPGQKLRIP